MNLYKMKKNITLFKKLNNTKSHNKPRKDMKH